MYVDHICFLSVDVLCTLQLQHFTMRM